MIQLKKKTSLTTAINYEKILETDILDILFTGGSMTKHKEMPMVSSSKISLYQMVDVHTNASTMTSCTMVAYLMISLTMMWSLNIERVLS